MAESGENIPINETDSVYRFYRLIPIEQLGRGNRVNVVFVRTREGTCEVILKLYDRRRPGKDAKLQKLFRNEVSITKQLFHKNINKIMSAATFSRHHVICMVPQYERTLMDALVESGSIGLKNRQFYELCSAVQYMHDRNIIHTNINFDCIFLGANSRLMLSGLKYARALGMGETLVTGFAGTVPFVAPEVNDTDMYNGFLVDSFAVGVVLLGMALAVDPSELVNGEIREQPEVCLCTKTTFENMVHRPPSLRWGIHQAMEFLSHYPSQRELIKTYFW